MCAAVSSSRRLLGPRYYREGLLAVLLAFINALLDVFSAACLLPVLFVLITPRAVERSKYLYRVYEWAGSPGEGQFLLEMTLLLFMLFLGRCMVAIMIHRFQAGYVFRVSAGLSRRMYDRYFSQSFLEFTSGNSATAARRIMNIPNDYAQHVLFSLIQLFNEGLVILFILSALAFYDPVIMLPLSLVALPLMLISSGFRNKKLHAINGRMKHLYDLNLKGLMMGIDGYVELKLGNRHKYYVEQFDENNRLLAADHAFLTAIQSSSARMLELVAVSGLCLVLALFTLTAGPGAIPAMGLGVFAVALFKVLPSVNRIFSGYVQLRTYAYTLDMLDGRPGSPAPLVDAGVTFDHSIELRHIGYTYPGAAAACLKNVDLVICRGGITGIAGRSGAGKTTLLRILTGLLEGYSGGIWIDGRRLSKENIPQWQDMIAYVPQNPVIFDAGFSANIAPGETREEINWPLFREALHKAQLGSLQESLGNTWQQTAGENGARLSGGQKQRIAIARALYRDTPILIFDEPFSNLDRHTEEDILAIINRLAGEGKTIVIVSHHARSLSLCDDIYELNGGMLCKTGHYHLPG